MTDSLWQQQRIEAATKALYEADDQRAARDDWEQRTNVAEKQCYRRDALAVLAGADEAVPVVPADRWEEDLRSMMRRAQTVADANERLRSLLSEVLESEVAASDRWGEPVQLATVRADLLDRIKVEIGGEDGQR